MGNQIKRLCVVVVSVALLAFGLAVSPAQANGNCSTYFAGRGDGTPEDPYQVGTRTDLEEVTYCRTSSFIQTADIDLDGSDWSPIGSFTGHYQGDNHEIANLTVTTGALAGLFSELAGSAVVSDVSLVSAAVAVAEFGSGGTVAGTMTGTASIVGVHADGAVSAASSGNAGGLVGYMTGGSISGSAAVVAVESTSAATVGGLVGSQEITGTIDDSYATGDVTSDQGSAGGLVGTADTITITDSFASGTGTSNGGAAKVGGIVGDGQSVIAAGVYATGNVHSPASAGGLFGALSVSSAVTDSYAWGEVSGGGDAGGIVGHMNMSSSLERVYAIGRVEGDADTGGLVGEGAGGSYVNNSIWNIDTTEQQSSSLGGNGMTTEEMQTVQPYADSEWSISTGWSPGSTWGICDASYPLLSWQVNDFPCVGHLQPTAAAIDTGGVVVGHTTAVPVVFRNVANYGSVTPMGSATTGDSQFTITNDGCTGMTLAPTQTCTVTVDFSPTAVQAYASQVSVSSDGAESPATVDLAGSGTSPSISFTPPTLTFGDQSVGTKSTPQVVTLTNSGVGDLEVGEVSTTGSARQMFEIDAPDAGTSCIRTSPNPVVLASGESCAVKVVFAPTSVGAKSAALLVESNIADETVPLSGTGTQDVPTPQTIRGNCANPNTVSIPARGAARLMGANCRTNTGQRVGVAVSPVGARARGDVRYYRLFCQTPNQARRGVASPTIGTGHGRACARGVLKVQTFGKRGLRLRVAWMAPAIGNYAAYRAVRVYRA